MFLRTKLVLYINRKVMLTQEVLHTFSAAYLEESAESGHRWPYFSHRAVYITAAADKDTNMAKFRKMFQLSRPTEKEHQVVEPDNNQFEFLGHCWEYTVAGQPSYEDKELGLVSFMWELYTIPLDSCFHT